MMLVGGAANSRWHRFELKRKPVSGRGAYILETVEPESGLPIWLWSLSVLKTLRFTRCASMKMQRGPRAWGLHSLSSTLECKWIHFTTALLKPWQIARRTRSCYFTYPTLSCFFRNFTISQPSPWLVLSAGVVYRPTMFLLSCLHIHKV